MLKVLKSYEELSSSIVPVKISGNSSSLPLQLHYLALSVETNRKAVILTSNLSEMNYRLICSKSAVRWNPQLVTLVNALEPTCSFSESELTSLESLETKILESSAQIVIFDDLSVFEDLGVPAVRIALFISQLFHKIRQNSETVTILAPFSKDSLAYDLLAEKCLSEISISPAGHGFSTTASAKCDIKIKHVGRKPSSQCSLLLSGERTNNAVICGSLFT